MPKCNPIAGISLLLTIGALGYAGYKVATLPLQAYPDEDLGDKELDITTLLLRQKFSLYVRKPEDCAKAYDSLNLTWSCAVWSDVCNVADHPDPVDAKKACTAGESWFADLTLVTTFEARYSKNEQGNSVAVGTFEVKSKVPLLWSSTFFELGLDAGWLFFAFFAAMLPMCCCLCCGFISIVAFLSDSGDSTQTHTTHTTVQMAGQPIQTSAYQGQATNPMVQQQYQPQYQPQ